MENQPGNYRLAVSSCAKDEASFLASMIALFSMGEINSFEGGTSRSRDLPCFLGVGEPGAPERAL